MAGKHFTSNKCALPVILKIFSLLVGPNDVVRYGVTLIPTFLSGIGRYFKRSFDTIFTARVRGPILSSNHFLIQYVHCSDHSV